MTRNGMKVDTSQNAYYRIYMNRIAIILLDVK